MAELLLPTLADRSCTYGRPMVVKSHLPLAAGCTDRGVLACTALLAEAGLNTVRCTSRSIEVDMLDPAPWGRSAETTLVRTLDSLGRCFAEGAHLVLAVLVEKHWAKGSDKRFARALRLSFDAEGELCSTVYEVPWEDRAKVLAAFGVAEREIDAERFRLDVLSGPVPKALP